MESITLLSSIGLRGSQPWLQNNQTHLGILRTTNAWAYPRDSDSISYSFFEASQVILLCSQGQKLLIQFPHWVLGPFLCWLPTLRSRAAFTSFGSFIISLLSILYCQCLGISLNVSVNFFLHSLSLYQALSVSFQSISCVFKKSSSSPFFSLLFLEFIVECQTSWTDHLPVISLLFTSLTFIVYSQELSFIMQ